jgi:hypothetical protein
MGRRFLWFVSLDLFIMTKESSSLPLKRIHTGERHRRDMGDLSALAASIAELGLLHPIVVTPKGELVAGERRLRAFHLLGRPEIPVRVLDLDAVVKGEFAENAYRKDFTLSEAVAIKRAIEPLEKAAAKERQREGGRRGGEAVGKLPEASKGRVAEKAARATGMARRTLEKAEAVVAAAEAEPEKFGKLVADMDRTGRANGVYRRLCNARQAELIRAEPPPPPARGPYRVIVVDPPWPYELRDDDPSHRAIRPYPTMSIEQMCALPVDQIMHANAVLWMWIPNWELVHGVHLPILRAWGAWQSKTILTWEKDKMGFGDWLRSRRSTPSWRFAASRSSRSPTRARCCARRCVLIPRSPPSFTTSLNRFARRRGMPIFSRAIGTMTGGIATGTRRRASTTPSPTFGSHTSSPSTL